MATDNTQQVTHHPRWRLSQQHVPCFIRQSLTAPQATTMQSNVHNAQQMFPTVGRRVAPLASSDSVGETQTGKLHPLDPGQQESQIHPPCCSAVACWVKDDHELSLDDESLDDPEEEVDLDEPEGAFRCSGKQCLHLRPLWPVETHLNWASPLAKGHKQQARQPFGFKAFRATERSVRQR